MTTLNNKIWLEWFCTVSGKAPDWPGRFHCWPLGSQLPRKSADSRRSPCCELPGPYGKALEEEMWWGERRRLVQVPDLWARNQLGSGANLSSLVAWQVLRESGIICPASPSWIHHPQHGEKKVKVGGKLSCVGSASVNGPVSYYWTYLPTNNNYTLGRRQLCEDTQIWPKQADSRVELTLGRREKHSVLCRAIKTLIENLQTF